MGGGTGTGAAPVIAEIAKELGILTIAVVTKPFAHEGKKRMAVAQRGIDELRQYTDSLILIPNEKLSLVLGKKVTLLRSEEHTSELQSLIRTSTAVCSTKKKKTK